MTPASHHARERAISRYGLDASDAEWWRLVADILDTATGERTAALLLARLPHGNERWLARLGTTPIVAVWSPNDAIVVTVLPTTPRY